ncbi:ABC transporter permease [Pseudoalteromonas citrea]|nr:ABC transporter permease [Pseudoalteromonas citrea]
MILIIALGIAASMVTYTISYMMNQHPMPTKQDTLQLIHLSSWSAERPYRELDGKEDAPSMMTYQDAENLFSAHKASSLIKHQSVIGTYRDQIRAAHQPITDARLRSMLTINHDFFPMFDVPFLFGSAWSKRADEKGELVAVISSELNQQLFNGENSVGKQIIMGNFILTISGVTDNWLPTPKFYYVRTEGFVNPRDIMIPFQSQIQNGLFAKSDTRYYCVNYPTDESFSTLLASSCVWLHFWVELNSGADLPQYNNFLNNYDAQQKQAGRFQRALASYTLNIKNYLTREKMIPEDTKLAVWLAFSFLIVCLLNCMSLMLNKFYNKRGEVGLRRAVGASQQNIAFQFGSETLLISVIGGCFGLLLTKLGLLAAQKILTFLPKQIMEMNLTLAIMTLILSVVSCCVFSLWPIYKAIKVQPSSQLKSL